MSLDEVFAAKRLMRLEPFLGYRPCKVTGRYYYAGISDNRERKTCMVEVKEGLFSLIRKYVPLSTLEEVFEHGHCRLTEQGEGNEGE